MISSESSTLVNNRYILVCVCLFSFIFYYFPFICLGEDAYIIIHDNLDSTFVWDYLIANKSGAEYYQNSSYLNIMNGLQDEFMPSSWSISVLFFKLFPPFIAYFLNDLFGRLIGLIGMILLMKDYIVKTGCCKNTVIVFVSIIFCFIGTYVIYSGLTVLGQPLLLWLMWNLYEGKYKWWYFVLIPVYALTSSLTLSGVFILIMLGVWWFLGGIKDKKKRIPFLVSILLLLLAYVVVENKIFYNFFFSTEISHRFEFQKEDVGWWFMLKNALKGVLVTQYHSGAYKTFPIIIFVLLVLFYRKGKVDNLFKIIFSVIILICLWSFVYNLLLSFLGNTISILTAFNWERFYFVLPMCWILLFSCGLSYMLSSKKKANIACSFLFIFLMFANICYCNQELRQSYFKLFIRKELSEPSYKEFFDRELFSTISNYIQAPINSYRIVSVGMHPSIPLFNGFYCLDGYQPLYPLSYKHEFRELIAGELDKNSLLKEYFDDWGSRCYAFSSELFEHSGNSLLINKKEQIKIKDFKFNYSKFKDMGGLYILSTVEILNIPSSVVLQKVFEGNWKRIYLYKVQ